MDNVKTGGFIKELRKEKEMTQKQLADLLHITDRAVSKWERGICAPDIALLEPLAEILGVSIVELIQGERAERSGELEAGAKEIIRYSRSEVARKVRGVRKKYLAIAALFLAAIALICGLLLWRSGRLFILDEVASPDGKICTTVYSKRLNGGSFSFEDEISIITEQEDGLQWRVIYGECTYRGLWWGTDSASMLIYYSFEDHAGEDHTGYFWYNCETWTVDGILEMDSQ